MYKRSVAPGEIIRFQNTEVILGFLVWQIRRSLVLLAIVSFGCSASLLYGRNQDSDTETPVEYVVDRPKRSNVLATLPYPASEKEQPFFKKLAPDEITTGGLAGEYDIKTRDKTYVGWFGIVREIKIDKASDTTTLLIEHKYFDGLTDAHIQALSFNGSGDFEAVLKGTNHFIGQLELVKVYGKVTNGGPGKTPLVNVQFARCWEWGTFTFIMAAGKQRGSEKWRKLNKIPLNNIYSSLPDENYYVDRLGATTAIKKRIKVEELARTAAVKMGVDPKLLRRSSGKFERLISNDVFRKRATEAALKLQPDSKGHVEPIVGSIVGADYEKLHEAIDEALEADFHDAVATVLAHALVLDDDDDTAATSRLDNLGYSARKCLPALIEALRCDDDWSRSYSADVLGEVGPQAETSIPALIMLLTDSDEYVRSNAADALGRIRRRPELVVPALVLTLDDADSHVRYTVAGALGLYGRQARSAAPRLAELVKNDKVPTVRWGAARPLGLTGNVDVALPVLIEALSSRNPHVQRFAAMGIGKLGPPAAGAVPHLHKMLNDADAGVRIAVAEALWRIDRNTTDTLPVLKSVLARGGFPAYWAGNVVKQFGVDAKPLLPVLIQSTRSDIHYVRSSAVKAIANCGTEAVSAMPRLKELLEDEDVETRVSAAAAMWKIQKDESAIPFLIKELESDNHGKSSVIEAIGMIGEPARHTMPNIKKHLISQNYFVRKAAAKTLKLFKSDE